MKTSIRTGWWARPAVAAGIAGALIVGLVATAVVFSIARGTSTVADLGTGAVFGEASLSAAAAARNRTVQAHLIGRAHELGFATDDELQLSLERTQAARDELVHRTERMASDVGDVDLMRQVAQGTASLVAALDVVAGEITQGDLAQAATTIDAELEPSYSALAALLADQRDEAVARMAVHRDNAGRLGDAASFLVALLLPLSVLLVYRARVRNAQKRRDLESSLEKQQAVSKTKDELIANLSHELRTPLTAIYGFALELIDQDPSQRAVLAPELARLIAGQSAELSRMVEDLLTAATEDQDGIIVTLEDVDPAVEVATVLEPLTAMGTYVDHRADGAIVTVDQLRLRQIIRNLVSNALRHGGPRVSVLGRVRDGRYVLEVRDDGPGVPHELVGRLFSRFIHEGDKPLVTGSVGLGLSIAQLLAERMGGSISYRRDFNETVFAVALPLSPRHADVSLQGTPLRPGASE